MGRRPDPDPAPAPDPDDGPGERVPPATGGDPSVGAARPPIPWRRNLWALWVAQMLAIMGFSLRVPFLPFFLEDLGTDSTDQQVLWSGLITAGGAAVMAVSAPLWGIVSDRYGRKPMVLRSMFAAMATVSLMGLATAPWHLLALRFVEGAFTGTVTASTALVAAGTPRARLGFGLGMIQTAVFSGASVGPLVGGLLADRIGYRPTFAVAGAMLGAAGLIVLFLVEERFAPAPRGPLDETLSRRARFRASAADLLGPVLLTMIAVMFVVRGAALAIQPILPLYVEELTGGDAEAASTLAGLILGVAGLTSALASVVLGRLGDRIGHRPILLWCAVGAGALYLPMAAAGAPWQLAVLQGLFGVAAGGLIPAANALVAAQTPPARRGVVFGLTAAAASLGGAVGPLAGAALAAAAGFPAAFLATGLALLALAAAIARLPKPGSRGVEKSRSRAAASP